MAGGMEGKTVLITGASSGIGKETAKGLVRMGADLVLVCRRRDRAERAVSEIKSTAAGARVGLVLADLLNQSEVRRAAGEFLASHDRLDVLVNNAGTDYLSYGVTGDGIERTMAVNYFAPFLLTNLLAGALERASPSRVVNVASDAHYRGGLDVGDLNSRSMGLGGLGAYARSKLALVLFTYELARRLAWAGVTSNCCHPGVVRTNIWRHAGPFNVLTGIASAFMISAEKGAETPVYLSSSPEVAQTTGKYFDKMKEKRSSTASYDERLAAELWDRSLEVTGLPPASSPTTS